MLYAAYNVNQALIVCFVDFDFDFIQKKQERMWNSFQGDRESGLFWLLSESIGKD